MGGSELQSTSWRRRSAGFVCALLALLTLVGCNAFDRGDLLPPPEGSGGSGGMGGPVDAGDEDTGVCTPSAETCNGADEDCDGVADEDDPDALAACEHVVVHANVKCASTTTSRGQLVLCVNLACDPGFSTCDGIPSNGCEFEGDSCPSCLTCEDAGDDDDSGSLR
jgi:hypothetical protein